MSNTFVPICCVRKAGHVCLCVCVLVIYCGPLARVRHEKSSRHGDRGGAASASRHALARDSKGKGGRNWKLVSQIIGGLASRPDMARGSCA
jgi:hypothetical protein